MTHDLGDTAHPAVAPVGRWRLLGGDRRMSRAKAVAPVDEPTVDLAVVAYERMLANAENHILTATAAVDARVGWTRDRQRWAGMTQQQMLKAFADALLEIRIALTGKAK